MSARDVIAAHLDLPNVHMGGPRPGSLIRADAILAALSAAGWVVVPREPTEAMLQTFHDTVLIECYPYARTASVLNDRATYRTMIATATEEASDDGR